MAEVSVTVAVVLLRVMLVTGVAGIPALNSAAVMPSFVFANGVAERLLLATQLVVPDVQVYMRRGLVEVPAAVA